MKNKSLVSGSHADARSQTLGSVIRRFRRECGLSQAALARKVGVDQQAVSQLETAAPGSSPRLAHLCLIADALGTTPYELFDASSTDLDEPTHADLALRLGDFLAARVERHLAPRSGPVGAGLRRLVYAEERRRRGHPSDAVTEAMAVAHILTLPTGHRQDDVERAAVLLEAYILLGRSGLELHGRGFVLDALRICREIDTLLGVTALGDQPNARARALLLRADVCMLAGGAALAGGRGAVELAMGTADNRALRLEATRVRAGIARRLGDAAGVRTAVASADALVSGGTLDPALVAFVYQGFSGNLAALTPADRSEAWRVLAAAEVAAANAWDCSEPDTHILSLIPRSRAVLAALAGPRCDLELAERCALTALRMAESSGRARTAGHCRTVLDVVARREPLRTPPD